MIDANNLLENLRATFSPNINVRFYEFLKRNRSEKWMIAADFVVSGQDAFNDVFAFTIIPYSQTVDKLAGEAKRSLPKDIKRIRSLDEEMVTYLNDERRFHFCFVTDDSRYVFADRERVRCAIAEAVVRCRSWRDAGKQAEFIKHMERLQQRATASGFNAKLVSDIGILAVLYSLLLIELVRHTNVEVVGIFADRDKMTTAYSGIFSQFIAINFSGLCQAEGFDESRTKILIGGMERGRENELLWYDAFIRIPDFLAGSLAKWNIRENLVWSNHKKFMQVIDEVIADNPTVAIILMRFSIFGARCMELRAYSKSGRNLPSVFVAGPKQLIDYEIARFSGFLRGWPRAFHRED